MATTRPRAAENRTTKRLPFVTPAKVTAGWTTTWLFCLGLVTALGACNNIETNPAVIDLTVIPTAAAAPAGEPNLAAGTDGSVYLSWLEKQTEGFALRFARWKDGVLEPPRTVVSRTDFFVNWADFPMLAQLADGTLAAHWLQRKPAGGYAYDVKVTTSRDGGQSWSEAVQPHRDSTDAEHGFVSLFALNDRFGVVWLDGRKHAAAQLRKAAGSGNGEDGEMTVRFTTMSPAGELGEEIEIDGRSCDCCQTSVAVTSAGPVLVYRDRSADEIRDIHVARQVNGKWLESVPIRSDNWRVNFCPVNGPSIAARNQQVAVAWFTAANDSPRVYVAFSHDAGATFSSGYRVDDGSPIGRVDVQMMDNGHALVSWLERIDQAAAVRVRRLQPDGRASAATTISGSTTDRQSGFPHMIVTGNTVIFGWTESGKPARVHFASAKLSR